MRVVGGSSCFESRKYAQINVDKAWDFICLIIPKLPIQVVKIDWINKIINCEGEKNKKYMLATKVNDGQTEVIMDASTKVQRVYGLDNNTKQVDSFFMMFEELLLEYLSSRSCVICKKNILHYARYCPECGAEQ